MRTTRSFWRSELPLLRHRSMECDTDGLSTLTPSHCSNLAIACGVRSPG
jgi:hypothetical protein